MTAPGPGPMPRVGLRVLLIGASIAGMAGVVLLLARLPSRLRAAPGHPRVVAAGAPGDPIASEANVFRLRPEDLAVAPATERRPQAHRRSFDMYHRLRAYPGAPPRIPHGLTPAEYRDTGCLTCHRRGGYAPRFGAYAPPTPHPEYASCLQCHLPDAELVRTMAATPTESCTQCHVNPDAPTATFRSVDWRPAAWPETDQRAMAGSPPLIPHDLQMRGNCLACHSGPAAVAEIRTTHPERASCRQCHLPASPDADAFTRPLDGGAARTGAAPSGEGR